MDWNYNYTRRLGMVGQFRYWCQKVLPAVYDDSLSYYELLCKVIAKLNELIEKDNEQSEVINIILQELEDLEKEFDDWKDGGFEDLLNAWAKEHMAELMGWSAKVVFFGLTLDGHFVAYIPDETGWDDVMFDTGQNYASDRYGRLILLYRTDASSDVWQEDN